MAGRPGGVRLCECLCALSMAGGEPRLGRLVDSGGGGGDTTLPCRQPSPSQLPYSIDMRGVEEVGRRGRATHLKIHPFRPLHILQLTKAGRNAWRMTNIRCRSPVPIGQYLHRGLAPLIYSWIWPACICVPVRSTISLMRLATRSTYESKGAFLHK